MKILILSFAIFMQPLPVLSVTMDEYIQSELERQKIPGLSLAIVRDGKIMIAKGYGMANLEHNVPAKPETVYQSGSVGKQFTATAVMSLIQEGKMKLEDPVTKYFPSSPAAWKKITIYHLLTHTSGIPDYTEKDVDFRRDYTEEELLKVLQKLPLEFAPGEKWNYSNSGYMLLGFLIHKASGKFYGDYLQERVFRPLEMTTTRIINEADIIPNRAAGYELVNGAVKNQEWVAPKINTAADGSLYFTVLDLAKWDAALYTERVLPTDALRQMWTPVKLKNDATYPYGFGWGFGYQRGHNIIEHSGHWQGFSTAICRYVDDRLTVIVLANLGGVETTDLAHNIIGLYEPALLTARFLQPEEKTDPAQTVALKRALKEIVDGSVPYPWPVTPSAEKEQKQRLESLLKQDTALKWIACDDVGGKNTVIAGKDVSRFCYYKITGSKGYSYATFALSDSGRIVDYSFDTGE